MPAPRAAAPTSDSEPHEIKPEVSSPGLTEQGPFQFVNRMTVQILGFGFQEMLTGGGPSSKISPRA